MNTYRLFTSAAMNPASGSSGPSGVAGAIVAPNAPIGTVGTVQLPTVAVGGGVLIHNQGSTELVLFYAPGVTAPNMAITPDMAANGGTKRIPGNSSMVLDNATGGAGCRYMGGPFTAVPGTFCYAENLYPVDHPAATVKI